MMADFLSNLRITDSIFELKSATFLPFAAASRSSPYSRLNASNSSLSCIPTLPDGESTADVGRLAGTNDAREPSRSYSKESEPSTPPLVACRSDDAARLAASLARRTCLGVSSPTLLPKTRAGA